MNKLLAILLLLVLVVWVIVFVRVGKAVSQEAMTTSWKAVQAVTQAGIIPQEEFRIFPPWWATWGSLQSDYDVGAHRELRGQTGGLVVYYGPDGKPLPPVVGGYSGGIGILDFDPFGWIDDLLDDNLP